MSSLMRRWRLRQSILLNATQHPDDYILSYAPLFLSLLCWKGIFAQSSSFS